MYRNLAIVTATPCTDLGRACADGITRGIYAAELKRLNYEVSEERKRAERAEARCGHMISERITEIHRNVFHPRRPLRYLQDAWAMIAGCAIAWSELLFYKLKAFIKRHPLIVKVDD